MGIVAGAARFHLAEILAYPIFPGMAVLQPLFIGVTSMYMLRHAPDFHPSYVVVGTALTSLWTTIVLFSIGSLYREQELETLDKLIGAPAPLPLVLGGAVLADVLVSIPAVVVSYGVGAWLFGYPVSFAHPATALVSFPLTLIALWAVGMVFAALAIQWLGFSFLLGAMGYPIYILSGFLFPISLLPGWLLPASYALPPYWAARALHGAAAGHLSSGDPYLSWGFLLLTALLAVIAAVALCRLFELRARRAGTVFWD